VAEAGGGMGAGLSHWRDTCSALGAGTVERSESAGGWDRREGSGNSGQSLAGGPGVRGRSYRSMT